VLVSPDLAVQTQVVPDDTFDHRPVISSILLTR
jgi:hypothetical protein